MSSRRSSLADDVRVAMSHAALSRARHLVGAQALLLAENMESGVIGALNGPEALRLLAMVLVDEPARAA